MPTSRRAVLALAAGFSLWAADGMAAETSLRVFIAGLQQQYLTTVLTSQDSAIDVMLIDVVRPAQYAAAGWAEPLDGYLGVDAGAVLGEYLPAYGEANSVNGKVMALPAFADALFLFY